MPEPIQKSRLRKMLARFKLALFRPLSDRTFIKLRYLTVHGRFPDLDSPTTYSEKIQVLKLYQTDKKFSDLADKLEVRQFVAETIGAGHLAKLLWSGTNPNLVPFEELPDSFVIKCTHGSGYNVIVPNKAEIDSEGIRAVLKDWLSEDYSEFGRERQYSAIPPRIIVEEFLNDGIHPIPPDYKFYCFEGIPKFVQVDIGRYGCDHRRMIFDSEMNPAGFSMGDEPGWNPEEVRLSSNIAKMSDLATKMATGFPLVRVDFYDVNGRIVFGEMTFTPHSGYTHFPDHEKTDAELGILFDVSPLLPR